MDKLIPQSDCYATQSEGDQATSSSRPPTSAGFFLIESSCGTSDAKDFYDKVKKPPIYRAYGRGI